MKFRLTPPFASVLPKLAETELRGVCTTDAPKLETDWPSCTKSRLDARPCTPALHPEA